MGASSSIGPQYDAMLQQNPHLNGRVGDPLHGKEVTIVRAFIKKEAKMVEVAFNVRPGVD